MDTLRLAVAPVDEDAGGGFQVQVYVNGLELTQRGAGLGMDPYDVLVPVNRFVAGDEPQVVPIARCGCGEYGCGVTDARVSREADRVRWEWEAEVPMRRPAVFAASEYDREVRRIGSDHSWETTERTAGRLILSSIAAEDLPNGLRFDWVGNDWRDPQRFQVCLEIPGEHQIFVDFAWANHSPQTLAAEVRRVLTTHPPSEWLAKWHSVVQGGGPPAMAGPRWTRYQL